jgi:ferredoxin-NADP reductase
LSFKTYPVRVVSRRMITPTSLQLDLEREDGTPLERAAGQFVNVHFVPPGAADGALIHRSYSVADAPGGDGFCIAVAPVEGGRATAHLFGLKPGDQTQVSGPYGRFVLRDDPPSRHLLVGTGTGVTPYRAMLPELAARLQDPAFSVILLLGVRDAGEALYADEFRAFAAEHPRFEFRTCLSRVAQDACGEGEVTGYVQAQFESLALEPERDIVYLCGNPDMIDQAFAQLKALGFPMASVRREKYLPARS